MKKPKVRRIAGWARSPDSWQGAVMGVTRNEPGILEARVIFGRVDRVVKITSDDWIYMYEEHYDADGKFIRSVGMRVSRVEDFRSPRRKRRTTIRRRRAASKDAS